MDDRTRLERPDDQLPPVGADAPTEVVRMVGAGEVVERPVVERPVVERGGAGSRRAEGRPRYGDRPESPAVEGDRPTLRFPTTGREPGAGATRPAAQRRSAGATSSDGSAGPSAPGAGGSVDTLW